MNCQRPNYQEQLPSNIVVYQSPQIQSSPPKIKVRVMIANGNSWAFKQDMVLNQVPTVGTTLLLDGESYKIESLLLTGSDCQSDSYEALVYPITRYRLEAPQQPASDCGCMGKPAYYTPVEKQCGCGSGCQGSNCQCSKPRDTCNPCTQVPLPVRGLWGYPW